MTHLSDKGSLLVRLEGLGSITRSEARIADHMQRCYPRIVFESLTNIASKCRVSKATVVRFIRSLGYTSFAEFQNRLQEELSSKLDSPVVRYSTARQQAAGGEFHHLSHHLNTIMHNLHETLDRISTERFDHVVEQMAFCRGTIYVTGQCGSIGLAQAFFADARYIRPGIQLLDNYASMMPLQVLDAGPDDILLAINKRRYASATVLVAKHFSSKGAKVVAVTDAEASPISPFADYILVAPSGGATMFESSCAILGVIEALAAALASRLEDELYKRFQVANQLYKNFGTLIDSPFMDK